VFDGTTPPYAPSAVTNPLQAYGKSKREGETVVLNASEDGASVVVLRVPVLSVYLMIIPCRKVHAFEIQIWACR
jgi:S-adenosylmethionine synthetase